MAPAKKRRKISKAASKPEEKAAWMQYINSGTLANLVLVGGSLTVIAYIWTNILRPVSDSGPLPLAGRIEVTTLREDTTKSLSEVTKNLSETLEVAKTANQAAQQAVQAGN